MKIEKEDLFSVTELGRGTNKGRLVLPTPPVHLQGPNVRFRFKQRAKGVLNETVLVSMWFPPLLAHNRLGAGQRGLVSCENCMKSLPGRQFLPLAGIGVFAFLCTACDS